MTERFGKRTVFGVYCLSSDRRRSRKSRTGDHAGPGEAVPELPEEMPYITEEVRNDDAVCDGATLTKEENLYPYICNMRKGALAGFK